MAREIYLITGVMGHLGNTVATMLLERGCFVRGLALPGDESVKFDNRNIEIVHGNVCDRKSLEPFFANPNGDRLIVIHTAGLISIASKTDDRVYAVNVGGTANIIEMCIKRSAAKLVYISSVHAIPEAKKGQPMSEIKYFSPELVRGCYAKTKAIATQLVLDSVKRGLNASVVHPSGMLGPRDFASGHLTKLITDFMTHKLTAAVNGGYDMVDVRDVSEAVIACAKKGEPGGCYICSNRFVEIPEFLNDISELTGKKKLKTYLPMWFAKMTAPLAEAYYRVLRQTPLYTSYSLETLTSNSTFCHTKATNELGYTPRSLKQTLADTLAWLKKEGRVSY